MDAQIVLAYLLQQIAREMIVVEVEALSGNTYVFKLRVGRKVVMMNYPSSTGESASLYEPAVMDDLAKQLSKNMMEELEAWELKK